MKTPVLVSPTLPLGVPSYQLNAVKLSAYCPTGLAPIFVRLLIWGATAALWSKLAGELSPQCAQSAVPSAVKSTPAVGTATLPESIPPVPLTKISTGADVAL